MATYNFIVTAYADFSTLANWTSKYKPCLSLSLVPWLNTGLTRFM